MNTYLELLKANANLRQTNKQHKIELLLLNNITINPIKEYLEYNCALNGIEANIRFGDYDNMVQNAQELPTKNKSIVVFWELANSIHGLEYKIDTLNTTELAALEQKIKWELKFTFDALADASLLIMNRFTALPFTFLQTESGALEALAKRLNNFCDEVAPSTIKWVNIDKCLVKSGIDSTIDYKGYLKNKLLYKHAFYWNYSQLIQPYFNALCGKVKKLLALDCDNTLWKGILGEDGVDHIAMDENSYAGQPFAAAQYRAIALGQKGVLLALASKNNAEDVDSLLQQHPNIQLKEEHLLAKKVNWETKGENLLELAKEINIGIDSFVFVDDSDFEIQAMQDQLPAVKSIKVPKNATEYYVNLQQWANHFIQLNESQEDAKKLEQYQQNLKRANSEDKFENFEGFLADLNLEMTIHRNDESLISRMAQMTQKTNQFNLTTPRYTEAQIKGFVKAKDSDCFAFGLKDKFGDSGITGLCIVHYTNKKTALIDTLLMSCRVLGRKVEFKFMEELLSEIFKKAEEVEGYYLKSNKNMQVADFYEKLGFEVKDKSATKTLYSMKKNTFEASNVYNYIQLNYA